MSAPGDTTEELQRCLRDIMGLLALPAGWRGLAPEDILANFSDALDASVELDVLITSARSAKRAKPILRVHGASGSVDANALLERFAPLATKTASAIVQVPCGSLGTLTALYEPIGYFAALGYVIAASARPGFPSANELAIIHAATSLATTAMETARAMREREEALRAKDDFLAVLGHELRNPLAPITTALALIRHRSGGQLSREEQVIERQVEHLSRLVDDLLDVARISRGTIELKRTFLELSVVVEQAVEASEALMAQRRHTLHVDVPKTGLMVHGDPFRLLQVLVNLLTNAARYTPEGGHVELSAAAHHDHARICVRDNGIGMAPELIPRIFEPFVQAQRVSHAQYGGLGVGLALVHTLVTLHGGSVSAKSAGLGRGSQFVVELPLTAAPSAQPETRARPHERELPATTSRRVLVVDDNADAGELLGMALSVAGHEVKVLQEPIGAAEIADAFDAAVVVLDIGMPERDGYQVAAEIQQRMRGERAPLLIALTGYGQPDDLRKAKAAGFSAHFVKPVHVATLIATVAALGDARRVPSD